MTLFRTTGLGGGGRGGLGLLWGDLETVTGVVSGAAAARSLGSVRVPGRDGPSGTEVDLLSGLGLALLG